MKVTIKIGTYVNDQQVIEREFAVEQEQENGKILLQSIAMDDNVDALLNDTEDFMNAQNNL